MTSKAYNDWRLLNEMPEGWRIDKNAGSPLTGYDFIINGSPLKGGKRALLKRRDCPKPAPQLKPNTIESLKKKNGPSKPLMKDTD